MLTDFGIRHAQAIRLLDQSKPVAGFGDMLETGTAIAKNETK
jgi:hypothetical protein